MVMHLQDSCSNHHPTTTRGFLRTVNWNLNGAKNSPAFGAFQERLSGMGRIADLRFTTTCAMLRSSSEKAPHEPHADALSTLSS
jgi:hypothetical protein